MKRRRIFRIFTALVALMVALCAASSGFATAADTQSDLEKKLSQLEAREKTLKSQISSAGTAVEGSQAKLDNLKAQISVVVEQIETLNAQVDLLQGEIDARNDRIALRRVDLVKMFSRLRAQMRQLQHTGTGSDLQLLLENERYVDYLILSHLNRTLSQKADRLAAEVEAERVSIQLELDDLDGQKTEVDDLLSAANAKKGELDALYKQANDETNKLKKTLSSYKDQLTQTQKEEKAMEEKIAAIIKSKSGSGKYSGGTMFWPVPTVKNISSGFGYRNLNGTGKVHKGIDIANGTIPIYGESIVAAADGTVIELNKTNTWGGGYGYWIIIDHGKDSKGRTITTVYAHCSKVLCNLGDKVVGGKTVIAKAGNTGNVTGPHLHFEVRVNGTSVDPIANGYVKKN